jgi:2-dehydropantoate 2-reductase
MVRAGHQVTFVDREAAHVEAIKATGLTITGPVDEFTVQAPACTPATVAGQHNAILLCVKAHDTEQATRSLYPHLNPGGYVVSVQNGLNELVIGTIVGRERTVGSFINFGADYIEPGVIHFGGRGAVVLGELDGATTTRVQALQRAFLDFDKDAIVTTNIWGYLWSKLAYGAQLFATALTNEPIADALADPNYQDLYIAVAQEVLSVALAKGITPESFQGFEASDFLPGTEPARAQASLAEMANLSRQSAKTHSGIWRDLAVRQRQTEVDPMLGPVVAAGLQLGVPTPLTAHLIALIHDIEAGKRSLDLANLGALKALTSKDQ